MMLPRLIASQKTHELIQARGRDIELPGQSLPGQCWIGGEAVAALLGKPQAFRGRPISSPLDSDAGGIFEGFGGQEPLFSFCRVQPVERKLE